MNGSKLPVKPGVLVVCQPCRKVTEAAVNGHTELFPRLLLFRGLEIKLEGQLLYLFRQQ